MKIRNTILAVIGLLVGIPGSGAAQVFDVFSKISPNSGNAGSPLFEITAAITIPLGKSDSIITTIPFQSSAAVVKYVEVNGIKKYLLNSTASPIDSTYVTWTYIPATRKIILQTHDTLSNRSILTGFLTNLPRFVSTNLSFNISVTSRLNAETITNSLDSGMGFSITPDAAASIGIETLPDGTGELVTSITVPSDTTMVLYAIARDVFRNYVDTIRCRWRIEPAIGSIDQSDSTVTIHFDPVKKGLAVITAGNHTLGTGKLSVSIYGGTAQYLVIRNEAFGGGIPVDTVTMPADSSLSLYAAVYDRDDNFLADSVVHWRTTNDLDPISDSIGTKVIWNPQHAWKSGKILAYHSDTLADTSGTITVVPGQKRFISIVDTLQKNAHPKSIPIVTTDDSIALFAAFLDADSNFISNPNVFWSDSSDFADFTFNNSQSTTMLPTKAKDGLIIAEAEGFRGTLFTSVSAGSIHHLILRSEPAGGGDTVAVHSVSTDSSLKIFAAAYDRWNNFIADTPVSWTIATDVESTVTNNAASILFTPSTAGIRVIIHARYSAAISASTDSIDIGTGRAAYVWIVDTAGSTGENIERLSISADSSLTLYAAFYDADSNFINNASVSWFDSTGLGEFSVASGIQSTYSAFRAGKGMIIAAGNGLKREIFISVIPGLDHHLLIRTQSLNSGDTLKSITIPADTSLQLYASLYDRNGNFTGNKSSVWSLTGLDGSLSALNASDIRYEPKTSGLAGRIHAVFGDTIASMTDVITIIPGAVARIEIAVSEADSFIAIQQLNLRSGESRRLFAIAFDSDSNFVGTYAVQWSEKASIGLFSEETGDSVFLTARESGFSTLEITNGIFSKRIPLRVLFSPIYRLAISRNTASLTDTISSIAMTADSVITLQVIAYDSLGNFVGDTASVSWFLTEGLNTTELATDTSMYTLHPAMRKLSGSIVCRTVDNVVSKSIPLEIYLPVKLHYVSRSLDTTVVRPNDSVSFRFTLTNEGDVDAILDTTSSLSFTDPNEKTVSAPLLHFDTIPAGGTPKTIETKKVIIPDSLIGETYTPYFTVSGHDGLGQRISPVTLQGDPNSIYVPRVQTTLSVHKKRLTIEYDSVKITVRFRNYGAKITELSWGILPDSSAFASLYTTKGISELAEKDLDSVMMTGILAAGSDSGTMFLRSFLRGQVHGNVITSISDNSEPVILQHEPKISFRDSIFAPKRRTFGSPVNITAYLRNERSNLLQLDSVNTRIQLTERTSSLTYVIGVDPRSVNPTLGTGEIRSDSSTALSRIPAGKYEVRLLLVGIDGNGNPFTDTLTAQNDTLTIDLPADLRVVSNDKQSITVGQEYSAYPVLIENVGTSDVSLHDSLCSLIISNGQTSSYLTMTESASIPAGMQARIVFRADSLQKLPRGSFTHTLIFGGKDGNGMTFLDTVSEGSVTLYVVEPPKLEQLAVSPSLGILRGQSYAPMVSIHNAGGTGMTLNLNTKLTFFDGADSLVFTLAESSYVDKRETASLKFSSMDIHDSLDAFTATLTYSGRDQNGMSMNGARLHDSAIVSVYAPKLIYQRLSLTPQKIPAGVQSFPFSVRIKNSGNIAVTFDDSTFLSIGAIDTVMLSTLPTIAPGDSATLSFRSLAVPASWPSGICPVVLYLHGSYGSMARKLFSAVLADSIEVYTTNALSISAFSPMSVTTGQRSVQFSATVINHGAVAVTIDPDTTQLRIDSQLMIPMTGKPVAIGPGGSAEVEFEPFDVPGSPNGVLPAVFYLVAKDLHGNPVQQQFRRDITIHTGPVLVSVNPANDTIFVKRRSYAFRIPVMNSGDISFTADTGSSVMIGNDTVLVSNILSESVIASHSVYELAFRPIPFTDAPVGALFPMNLRLTGLDGNSKELDTTLFVIRTVKVVDTLLPDIVRTGSNAANKINPDSILTGSQDSQLRFRIINRNTTALGVDSIRFHFNGDTLGAYAVTGSSGALLIAPKDSLEQAFSVYAGPGVPLGATDISMRIYYRLHTYDSSQASMELQRVHTWTVRPAPVLAIDTVISSLGTMPVTEGSTHPFFIEVTLKNRSQKNVQINSGTLTFISGNTVMTDVLYSVDAGSSLQFGDIIPSNTVDKVRFIVTKMGKFRGENAIIVQSRVFGTEIGSGVRLADSTFIADPRHPLLTLLKQPSLEFVRLVSSKATVDAGDSVSGNPKVRTTVRNGGQAPLHRVTLDSIHWYYGGLRREHFRYVWKEEGNDISIAGDSTASFEISLTKNDIHPDSTNNSLTASLFFSGTDPYNGNAKIIDSLSAWDGTFYNAFRFQRPASISLDTPMTVLEPYDSIVVKNRKIYLRSTVRNQGAAAVSDISVHLTTSNTGTKIVQAERRITLLDSMQHTAIDFEITTADTSDITEWLTVTLSGGRALNTDTTPYYSKNSVNYSMKYLPGPPLIKDVRYVDNGYVGFPDAILNKGDLIKITFNDSISTNSTIPLDSLASRYFSLVPNTFHFGKNDASKIKKAEQVSYKEEDKNSVLFIELGEDALLAIGDSVFGIKQNGFNKVSQTATQSQIIINPAIEKNLLIGSKGNDAGLFVYRENLAQQLTDSTQLLTTKKGESNNTLTFYDPIPPLVKLLTPGKMGTRNSTIGAFITGRNLIQRESLFTILKYNGLGIHNPEEYFHNDNVLLDSLYKALKKNANADTIRSLLRFYHHEITDINGKYYTNPEYVFYNDVNYESVGVYITSDRGDAPNMIDKPEIKNDTLHRNAFTPYSNVTVLKSSVLIDLVADTAFVHFVIPVDGESVPDTNHGAYFTLKNRLLLHRQNEEFSIVSAPNPYHPKEDKQLIIEYYLSNNESSVEIVMIDAAGRLVQKWTGINGTKGVNRLPTNWYGRNQYGNTVSTGVYLLILNVNNTIRATWIVSIL